MHEGHQDPPVFRPQDSLVSVGLGDGSFRFRDCEAIDQHGLDQRHWHPAILADRHRVAKRGRQIGPLRDIDRGRLIGLTQHALDIDA